MNFKETINTILETGHGKAQGSIGDVFFKINIFNTNKPIVITFQNHGQPLSENEISKPNAYVWGYNFILSTNNYNVLSFSCIKKDNWYRDKQFIESLPSLSQLISAFPIRLGYGSSMGGYGVSAFSNILNIERLLLMNPISSLNKNISPWEDRFNNDLDYDWNGLYNDASITKSNGYVVFDPLFHKDKMHAEKYTKLRKIKLPGVGHAMPAICVT